MVWGCKSRLSLERAWEPLLVMVNSDLLFSMKILGLLYFWSIWVRDLSLPLKGRLFCLLVKLF